MAAYAGIAHLPPYVVPAIGAIWAAGYMAYNRAILPIGPGGALKFTLAQWLAFTAFSAVVYVVCYLLGYFLAIVRDAFIS
jgi:hypothetical protein